MKNNIKNQLRKMDLSKARLSNGNTLEQELKKHANVLADCIMEELDKVYDSYSPTVYKRTYNLYNSLHVGQTEIKVASGKTSMEVSISFDDGAIHTGFDGSDANTSVLLNEGWKWHNNDVDIPYFSRREGTHFIEKGIKRYKNKVSNPFAVELTINGEIRMF